MMALGLLDPEFWSEGYALARGCCSDGRFCIEAIPLFLEHVAELVPSTTGKAVGLVRAPEEPPLAIGFDNWGNLYGSGQLDPGFRRRRAGNRRPFLCIYRYAITPYL